MVAAYGAAVELPNPALVALGGVAGAATRWAALDLADHAAWSLVLVNSAGAFLLGMVAHGLRRRGPGSRLLLGVGYCGSLTTFSTLAVDVAADLDRGATADALVLVVASLGVGIAAATAGAALRRDST